MKSDPGPSITRPTRFVANTIAVSIPPLDESAIGVLSRLPSESEHFLEGRGARCRRLGFFVDIVGLMLGLMLSTVIVFIVFTLSDIDVAGHCCAGLFVRFVPLLLSSWVG